MTIFYCISILSQKKNPENNDYFFYENKGQIVDQDGKANPDVKYLFHSAGLNVQLRSSGFSYDIYETKKTAKPNSSKLKKDRAVDSRIFPNDDFFYENQFHRIDIELLNSNKNITIITDGKSPDYHNYYNIRHKPEGITSVHRFRKITYKNIYPHIDLVFFKPKDTLKPVEYNFIINPGGKISDIKMKFTGAPTSVKDKKLLMKVRFGEMFENIPNSWIEGSRKENIEVFFKDLGNQIFGFDAPVEIAHRKIIIDPVPTRVWGSYAGGYGEDHGRLKTDNQNIPYLYGATTSSDNIATGGAYQSNLIGQADAFVMKLTSNGQRQWSTYYGTPKTDYFNDVSFDENYNLYLGGTAEKTITKDALLVKLNSTGMLLYIKDISGTQIDECYTVSYNQNHVYIGGETMSTNFPVLNAAYPVKPSGQGYFDGFLMDIDSASGNTLWSTYFGGSSLSSSIYTIFSSTGDLEVIGASQSTTIPMINPFQAINGGTSDGLYLKFSKSGTLLRSSYFGDNGQEGVRAARIINNKLLLAGEYMDIVPNYGPVRKPGVWKVDLNTNIIEKVYFPFTYQLQLTSYVDTGGNILFGGLATLNQTGIATPNAYMTTTGPYIKTFLIKYNANNVKEWGTFYGGNGGTQLGTPTKDDAGFIYFTGMSSNNTTGIATPGTFQQQGGHPSNDIFIVKFQDCTSSAVISSNSPVCINSTLQLNASGGTSYNWTGPNGFTSTLQNPSIPNATAVNSGIYTCQVSGTGSCDGSFTVNVTVGDTVAPIPTLATLPDITGDCHTVVSNIPTAMDNCAGTITGTTTDPLSYSLPGTYIIHWTYNDGNGNISAQNQNVTVTTPALPTAANTQQTFCASLHPTLADVQITGQNIKWYDAAGTLLATTTPLVNGQTYYASQTINGCESNKIAIQVTVNNTPKPTGNSVQDFCASAAPTLASLVITGTSLKFYDAAGNILPITTPLANGTTYFVTQTLNSCESEKLAVTATLSTNNVPANDYSVTLCNSTTGNSMNINLTTYQSNIIVNPGSYTFTYTDNLGNPISNPSNYLLNVGSTVIHVKVSTQDGCFKIVRLNIALNPKPEFNLSEKIDFCKGKTVTLDAGSGYTSYLWSNGAATQTITVSAPGNYSVTVTNSFGCQSTDNIQVSYTVLPEIVSVNVSNNSATVILSATGNFEYSLDNFAWQDSNIFTNLKIGEYMVYVRTKGGCIIGQKPFSIFNIPNTFTPNGDGFNDQWKIAGLENYPGTEVNVYDRRGLPVFKEVIYKKPLVWDGKLNGSQIPTGNYWYTIKVSDGRVYTGWLLIKNRE